jgi:hypothetical protein
MAVDPVNRRLVLRTGAGNIWVLEGDQQQNKGNKVAPQHTMLRRVDNIPGGRLFVLLFKLSTYVYYSSFI